jgi:hypothetical protein
LSPEAQLSNQLDRHPATQVAKCAAFDFRFNYWIVPSGGWVDNIRSDGFDLAGVCSKGVVEVSAAVVPAGDASCGDVPRMTGKPSLPVPTITILELEDCAS